jgi:7,8-dihydropterin-6-yl-methyl-4-(beta-D-ribofuranosyl)aminobenzene 5'-phosphate synthase
MSHLVERLRITVLADNYVVALNVLGEHGLSMLIEADNRRILFDTGQGRVLLDNAEALGVNLAELDAVVLSHGHYDHTGGLAALLQECSPSAVFLHPAAIQPKYAQGERPISRQIGMPEDSRQALDAIRERITWTESATEVVPGVWCTGEIPRLAGRHQATAGFFLDGEQLTPDPLADDQALVIETPEGLVVIAGCAHSGIVNTLDRVCTLRGRGEVYALVGGFHLGRATRAQLDASVYAIGCRNCRVLAPCHCTGLAAHAHLRARFHTMVQDTGVGTRLALGGAGKLGCPAN